MKQFKFYSLGICFSMLLNPLGCSAPRNGMVMVLDGTYRPTIELSNDTGISAPDGLLWNQGQLLICDEGGSACRVWDRPDSIKTLCDAKLGIKSPEDLALDDQGNIFFTDDDAGGLWKISPTGQTRLLAGPDEGLGSTEGIALTPDGDVLVGEGLTHQIYRVTSEGHVSVFLGPEHQINKPESMAFDERGNLYIADNRENVLYLFSHEGKLQTLIDNRENFSPESIWYANGVLYLTDSVAGKVQQFTPAQGLQTIAVFVGRLRNVHGITTDEDGSIYVSVQTDLKTRIGYIILLERQIR